MSAMGIIARVRRGEEGKKRESGMFGEGVDVISFLVYVCVCFSHFGFIFLSFFELLFVGDAGRGGFGGVCLERFCFWL